MKNSTDIYFESMKRDNAISNHYKSQCYYRALEVANFSYHI